MKKKWLIATTLASALWIHASNGSALDLFKNSNTACNSQSILCTSGNCIDFGEPITLSCRNPVEAGADFDGNQRVDCVAALGSFPLIFNAAGDPAPDQHISVLLNSGGECASGQNRFQNSLDYHLPSLNVPDIGTILTGNLNNSGRTDLAIPVWDGDSGRPFVQSFNPGNGFGADGTEIAEDTTALWGGNGQFFSSNVAFDPQHINDDATLLDCNQDGRLDAALPIFTLDGEGNPVLQLNVLKNDGNKLTSAVSFSTGVTFVNDGLHASIAAGDFNSDGRQDVAIAFDDGNVSRLVICRSSGDCNFNQADCTVLNLEGKVEEFDVNPHVRGVAAGDFFGDGLHHLVVTQIGLRENSGLQYFRNNGAGTFAKSLAVPLGIGDGLSSENLTIGCFDNNMRVDVAVPQTAKLVPGVIVEGSPNGKIDVVTLDKNAAPTVTHLQYSTETNVINNNGIDAANLVEALDNPNKSRGGDDIVALGSFLRQDSDVLERRAFVFERNAGTLQANAGVNKQGSLNEAISLVGSCKYVNPEDPNAEYAVQWKVEGPNAGNAVLQNANTLTPTFVAGKEGAYTVTLECRSACTALAKSSITIQASGLILEGGGGSCQLSKQTPAGLFSSALSLLSLAGLASLRLLSRRKQSA